VDATIAAAKAAKAKVGEIKDSGGGTAPAPSRSISTFGNKVGTPRGYVDKAARDKVDEAMQPVAEIGKELPYFIPGPGEVIGAARLGGKAIEIGSAIARRFGGKTAAKIAETVAEKAVPKALEYKPAGTDFAKINARRDAVSSKVLSGGKTAEKGAVMTKGRQKLMDTLEKSRQAGAKARNTFRKDSGTLSSRVDKATATNPSTPRDGEKFGALVKKGDNLPAKQGTRAVTPYKEASKGVTKYKAPGGAVANFASKVGDKGAGSRLGSALKYGAVGAAVGGAGYGLYKGADKPKAEQASRGITGGDLRMTPDGRSPIGINRSKLTKDGKALFDKRQGQTAKKTVTAKAPGKATNKSRAAPKKMNAFEQMKQRQYEKEGGSRGPMTSSGAKAQVQKERAYKFKDLFGKKK